MTDATSSNTVDQPTTDFHELTGFQRDCLRTILALEADGPVSGQDIKHALEADQDREINHGRLYPNLDALVDAGLVTKGEIDARTNSYQTTDGGRELVRRAVQSWVDLLDADRQLVTDGGTPMTGDTTEELSIYVDTELLTRAKGVLMLNEGREPTTEEVIGKALQALVDEHTDDERPSLDLSPDARFNPIFDEAEQIDRSRQSFGPLFDDERHYPDGLDGLRRVEDENNSTTDDNQR